MKKEKVVLAYSGGLDTSLEDFFHSTQFDI